MNENKIIETLKYISQFVENRHDEGLGDYLHIVIGRTDINVIDETIYLLKRKQNEIERYKKEIKDQQKEIEELKAINQIQKYRIEVIDERELISKDKIREKIEELESLSKNITMQPSIYNYEIDLLKELLEE